MPLPKMAKTDWLDHTKRRSIVEAAIARAEAALERGGTDVAAAYRDLAPLIERELEDGTLVHDATDARWRHALASLHAAHYGFAPTRASDAQLASALPDIDGSRLSPLASLAAEIAEYADGGTLDQIANLLVKEAKRAGLVVSRREARRIVAAVEGAAIPSR